MSLELLRVENFRIIEQAEISPSPHLNLISGPNAAGKTSLLEAIDCLSRGRTFRSRKISSLLKSGAKIMRLSGRIHQREGQGIPIGMEKTLNSTRIRVRAHPAQSMSMLTAELPVQVIHPQVHELILGPPQQRRAFLDWGVFHVERSFIGVWQRYVRALKQRNAAVRTEVNNTATSAWHDEMTASANVLDHIRTQYMKSLLPVFHAYISCLWRGLKIRVSYQRGWADDEDLATVLTSNIAEDRHRGYTRYGPHRANLQITIGDQAASEVASRGQQKLLAAALKLAQTQLVIERSRSGCVLLVDDLPSELDETRRDLLFKAIAKLETQVFITTLSRQDVDRTLWKHQKVFHVERGSVAELL